MATDLRGTRTMWKRLASTTCLALAAATLGITPYDATLAQPAHAVAAPAAESPNIVVVMADDMRADDMRFAPGVRRLMRRTGVAFSNSFSPFPLCCPARASFLSGRYAHNHGVLWHRRPYGYGAFDDSRSLATALSDAGYRTGFLGKYLNNYGPARSKVTGKPSHTYVPDGWDDWRAAFENPHTGGIHGGTYQYLDTPYNVNGRVDNSHWGDYSTHTIGAWSREMAQRFTRRKARTGKPFFMYVNYVAPHYGGPSDPDDPKAFRDRKGVVHRFESPYVPARYRGKFDSVVKRASGIPRSGLGVRNQVHDKPRWIRKATAITRAEKRRMRELTRQRAESIWAMDRQVMRLVRTLKRSGEWEKTVLVFTSDNGYYLGEQRRRTGKVTTHEPSLRVPLLITGPGLRGSHGRVRHDPVTTVDLTATLLDLADARAPWSADGISRVPTLLHGDQGWSTPVVTEAFRGRAGGRRGAWSDPRTAIGLRTARWSLTLYRDDDPELYDLVDDPLQLENVWDERRLRGVRQELVRTWERMKDCAGPACADPLPESLRAGPLQNTSWSRAYWREVQRVYGTVR